MVMGGNHSVNDNSCLRLRRFSYLYKDSNKICEKFEEALTQVRKQALIQTLHTRPKNAPPGYLPSPECGMIYITKIALNL